MEHEPPLRSDFLAQPIFDVDLEPLYALSEPQYQAVINQLSNLVVAIVAHLQENEQSELAELIAGHAHAILVNYDEDIAEHIQRAGSVDTAEDVEKEQRVYLFPAQV
jgi:hypothetical protein